MKIHLFGAALLLLCAAGAASAGEDEDRIRKSSRAWEEAFNAGDPGALATLYTPDAMLLPPGEESVKGRKSVEAYWSGSMEGITGELDIREISVQGDLAYVLGTYKLFDSEGTVVDRGKYMEIRKRANGTWQLHRDIWNTSMSRPDEAPH